MDNSLIVLQIRAVNDEAAIALKDPRNAEFLMPEGNIPEPPSLDSRRRDGTPFIESSSFMTALRIDHYPFDPALGWVFGRDGENVDFVLGGREQGVSQQHFRIDHNWKAMTLVLTNLSGNCTKWANRETGELENLTGSRAIVGQVPYEIAAGVVRLTLQIPVRTQEQQARYDVRVKQLREEVMLAAPTMQGFKIARLDEDPTPLVAGMFVLGHVIGTGMTAVVHEAVDRDTGHRFAAKVYKLATKSASKSMLREIKLLQKLKHVSCLSARLMRSPTPSTSSTYSNQMTSRFSDISSCPGVETHYRIRRLLRKPRPYPDHGNRPQEPGKMYYRLHQRVRGPPATGAVGPRVPARGEHHAPGY